MSAPMPPHRFGSSPSWPAAELAAREAHPWIPARAFAYAASMSGPMVPARWTADLVARFALIYVAMLEDFTAAQRRRAQRALDRIADEDLRRRELDRREGFAPVK